MEKGSVVHLTDNKLVSGLSPSGGSKIKGLAAMQGLFFCQEEKWCGRGNVRLGSVSGFSWAGGASRLMNRFDDVQMEIAGKILRDGLFKLIFTRNYWFISTAA